VLVPCCASERDPFLLSLDNGGRTRTRVAAVRPRRSLVAESRSGNSWAGYPAEVTDRGDDIHLPMDPKA
jgi:hypothetical protein